MIICAALLMAASVELPQVPVTAHLQAMTVAQALGLISKKAGITLTADDSLSRDIVVIRSQAAPLKELGRQLAVALDADWSGGGTKFLLSRSADAVSKEKADQLAFDAERFKRTQNDLKAFDKTLGEFDEAAAKKLAREMLDAQADGAATPVSLHSLEIQSPVMRLFSRIMASVPPEDLARIPHWGRVVYTIRPNRSQRGLSQEGSQALIAFRTEQDIWSAAAADMANLNLSAGLATAKPRLTWT